MSSEYLLHRANNISCFLVSSYTERVFGTLLIIGTAS